MPAAPVPTRTIFITGASSGIGRACAHLFASRGWNVVATMRDPKKAGDLARHPRIRVLRLDVLDEKSIRSAIRAALARFGSIDVLLNNAGYGAVGPLECASETEYLAQFDTNVFGPIRVIQAVLPSMRARRLGVLINVSSVAESFGMPYASLYHSSKWAVGGLSESLMHELAPLGIRVKLVQPPQVRTNFFHNSLQVPARPLPSVYAASFRDCFYLDRARVDRTSIPAEQVAEVVYRAATDGSSRLRYPVGSTGLIQLARTLLPAGLFYWLVGQVAGGRRKKRK